MEVGILGKITGQFLAHKSSTFHCLDLLHHVGRGAIWRRKLEPLEKGEHNKPSGCSASGAYALGPDYEEECHGDLKYHNRQINHFVISQDPQQFSNSSQKQQFVSSWSTALLLT